MKKELATMPNLALLVSLGSLSLRQIQQKKLAQELQAIMQRLANQELLLQSVVSNTMESLGNQEVRNAQEALKDALMSSSPRHELTSAINHLQSAASHFEEKAVRVHFGKDAPKTKDGYTVIQKADFVISENALSKAANCYAIIATIYSGLRERGLTVKYANLFKVAFMSSHIDRELRKGPDGTDEEEKQIFGYLVSLTQFRLEDEVSSEEEEFVRKVTAFPRPGGRNELDQLFEQKWRAWYPAGLLSF
jgi:hypothetical protein